MSLSSEQKLCRSIDLYNRYDRGAYELHAVKSSILECADVNYVDQYGYTPLALALRMQAPEIVSSLVKHGATHIEESRTMLNKYLCKMIWENGSIVKIVELVEDKVCDLNYTDEFGWSPLHLALKKNNIMLAKILLKGGADINKSSVNFESKTPLDIYPDLTSGSTKETIILFQGCWKEHHRFITKDPLHNLMHPSTLNQYFDVIEVKQDHDSLFQVISLLSKYLPALSLILDVHGELLAYNKYSLDGKDHNIFLQQICDASKGVPIKLFSTACYGQNMHNHSVKIPEGSKIITLSDKTHMTMLMDLCHKDMPKILETLCANKSASLSLEDLLEASCLSQRFVINTPTISMYKDGATVTIRLDEYFRNTLLPKLQSFELSDIKKLLSIKNLPEESIDKLLASSSEGHIVYPKSINYQAWVINQAFRKNPQELVQIHAADFPEGSLGGIDTGFLETALGKEGFIEGYGLNYATPLLIHHSLFRKEYRPDLEGPLDGADSVWNATPWYSWLLAMTSEHLIKEEFRGHHLQDCESKLGGCELEQCDV